MHKLSLVPVTTRAARTIAVVTSLFFLGACAEGNTASSLTGGDAPANEVITSTTRNFAGRVEVCINGEAGPGLFTVTTTSTNPSGSTSTTVPTTTLTAGSCQTVFQRTSTGAMSQVTVTVTSPTGAVLASGTSGIVCVVDQGGVAPADCIEPDATTAIDAVVFANFFHGTQVTFNYGPAITGEPDPEAVGCTVTRGFIRNQLDLLTNGVGTDLGPIVIAGDTLTTAEIAAALSAPVKGDSRVQLKAQLITALANVSLGATTNAEVDQAIADAQSYLAAGSTATKSQITAAISVLTAFNEGTAGNGASDHCGSEEEAILKDRASA